MSEKNKVSTVLIDDDLNSRKLLNVLLKKFPNIEVVGEAASLTKAIDIVQETKPDSVFLDICLGNNSGFDLVNKISPDSKVIFISAFDDYAIRAFKVNALDYIKKPIDFERLSITIKRLISNTLENKKLLKNKNDKNSEYETNGQETDELNDIIEEEDDYSGNEPEKDLINTDTKISKKKLFDYDDRIFISFDNVARFIKISSIECITAEKDYSYVYISGAKRVLVLRSMVEWEERLPKKNFVRIHRSTIANLEYIEKVEKWFNSSYLVFVQNISEPFQMSRRYATKLKERFK